jgi:hypothetical protein
MYRTVPTQPADGGGAHVMGRIIDGLFKEGPGRLGIALGNAGQDYRRCGHASS